VDQPKEFDFCKKKIQERNLPMKLASVEHLLGGSKIIFYFLAEGRVDFRELVKDLAQEYHTRIEMRQIGVRDEARLLADYEHCGRELCCKTFIKNLEPVTMKMAKNQKATLDPTKISGRCGRLMCCLRFEDSVYEDMKSGLPGLGVLVATPEGEGEVVAQDAEKKVVTVALADKRQVTVPVAQIKTVCAREAAAAQADAADEEQLPDE
jgi:cell fate regulator YaaT (PSP1 superfamily)